MHQTKPNVDVLKLNIFTFFQFFQNQVKCIFYFPKTIETSTDNLICNCSYIYSIVLMHSNTTIHLVCQSHAHVICPFISIYEASLTVVLTTDIASPAGPK